jgi:hypothetical protein
MAGFEFADGDVGSIVFVRYESNDNDHHDNIDKYSHGHDHEIDNCHYVVYTVDNHHYTNGSRCTAIWRDVGDLWLPIIPGTGRLGRV